MSDTRIRLNSFAAAPGRKAIGLRQILGEDWRGLAKGNAAKRAYRKDPTVAGSRRRVCVSGFGSSSLRIMRRKASRLMIELFNSSYLRNHNRCGGNVLGARIFRRASQTGIGRATLAGRYGAGRTGDSTGEETRKPSELASGTYDTPYDKSL